MFDLIVRAGTVVDGTGGPPFTADVGVRNGRVAKVGRLSERGRREIDADGLVVPPRFVDIHTHFDGQATWDPILAPSAWHGISSGAMGNCGVGSRRPDPTDATVSLGLWKGSRTFPDRPWLRG
jgi:N-acyl-D-amino-acid deacylase